MPPSKRKPRRSKVADLQPENSDVDMPDSSPSKPSAKKRKGNNGRVTKKERSSLPEPEPDLESLHDSEHETEELSASALIDKVTTNLSVSKDPVMVAADHANEKADEHKVSAFAKIAGRDWTYYVRSMSINIGRPPDDRQAQPSLIGASSPAQDLKENFPVHIDLGPSKVVSRHHASVFYDAEWPAEEGGWHVRVNGRNGVRVNNTLLRRGSRQLIKSGAVLEIAGTQMLFVTPGNKIEIDPYFVEKAEAAENGIEVEANATASESEGKINVANELPGYPSLAPAPANLKRTSTPPPSSQAGRGGQQSVFDSKPGTSPTYGRGMMLESTQEIDYSRDAAKDLKPPYSYAHMIAQAIFSSEDQKLTLSNIYNFIADKYAFYRHSNSGWQNSIRHNLSLNKAFQKVPRRTDEPGKGMKWMIAPEFRDEYWKKQQRRVGTSSNPSSPAAKTDVNPNFRGANGQNLGYDTSMVYQFSAKDAANPANAPPKLNMSFPPYPPQGHAYQTAPPSGPSSQPPGPASTPQRRRTDNIGTIPEPHLDDSPLPPHPFPSSAPRPSHANNSHPFYSLPPNNPPSAQSPTNPMLSSSYLDTPFHPSHPSSSLITPAPLRQNPKLAPPSTLVAPSKFMPESSPAGPGGLFWKGFLGNFTPGPHSAIPPDMSPEKLDANIRSSRRDVLEDRDIMSSSPPPMDADGGVGLGSPTKGRIGRGRSATVNASQPRTPTTESAASANGPGAFAGSRPSSSDTRPDSRPHTQGYPAVSTATESKLDTNPPPLQPSNTNAHQGSRLSLGPPPSSTNNSSLFNLKPVADKDVRHSTSTTTPTTATVPSLPLPGDNNDDAGDEGGFDLARGFAPIGSTQARSRSVRS